MTFIDSTKIIFNAAPPLDVSPASAVRPEDAFQLLNARVEQSGYRDYTFSEADAAHWNVALNHVYPSRQNIIFLQNASPPRPIHANRIQLGGKDYGIATILPHTADQIEDFYRCIVQEKIGAIVNVAQASDFGWLRPPRYWPDSTPKVFGEFTVCRSSEIRSYQAGTSPMSPEFQVHVCSVDIAIHGQTRRCTLVRCPDWRDGEGISSTTLARLVGLIDTTCNGEKLLIHCANGVGRTGILFTAIALAQVRPAALIDADLVDDYIIQGRLCRNKDFVANEDQYQALLNFAKALRDDPVSGKCVAHGASMDSTNRQLELPASHRHIEAMNKFRAIHRKA